MTPAEDRDPDLDWAIRLHKAGVHDEAAAAYRAVLDRRPDDPEVVFLLASVELAAGAPAAAAVGFARAALGLAAPAESLAGLSEALDSLPPDARRHAADAVAASVVAAVRPTAAAMVGRVLRLAGEAEAALALVERSLGSQGSDADLLRLRAGLLAALGRPGEATTAYGLATEADPDHLETLIAYVGSLVRTTRADAALPVAHRAALLSLDPARQGLRRAALQQLAGCFRELGRAGEAVAACRALADRAPTLPEPWVALARSLHAAGRHEAAEAAVADGLRRAGDDLELRWLHCFYALAPLYRSMAEIETRRAAYRERLAGLAARLAAADGDELARAAVLVGDPTPFLLPYQYGADDRALQAMFGAIARRVMARFDRPIAARPRADERIAVVFVSAFIWRHTNWRMKRGWVKHLDRARFHVSCLHLGERVDAMTREIETWCDAFHHRPGDFDGAIRLLRELAPDVVFYPEVGMSGIVQQLAALRLAPVQCCAWGHPVTTGLPTIDYFVSSELMEPEGAEAHYTETLVRLPGISFPYIPAPLAAPPLDRAAFGLPAAACLYLCLQTPQKYLPADDDLYPRIAEGFPDALFVFLAGGAGLFDMTILQDRLAAAFRARGLDPARHLRFLPHLGPERYQALNAIGDVYLDTPGWSGGNTTLEALQQDLPVVTLPGKVMRARHSAAMLRLVGVEATVARDRDDFVRIAIRLGSDPAWRKAISDKVRTGRPILETDRRSIAALEAFLIEASERQS